MKLSIPRPPQSKGQIVSQPLDLTEYRLQMRFTGGTTHPKSIWAANRSEALKLALYEVHESLPSNQLSWGKLLDWWVLLPNGEVLGNALSLGFVK